MFGTGKAKIDIKELAAGTAASWSIRYETGEYGIDDSGEILISRRDVSDSDIPQFEDIRLPGFVKVSTDADVKLTVGYEPNKYIRPWKSCICIKVSDGSLKPGDTIDIQYGSCDKENPGYRIQTFREEEYLFKIFVDCAGSGDFYEIDSSPSIKVFGGEAVTIEAVAPSKVRPDEAFGIFVRVLDRWGNIAERFSGTATLTIDGKERILQILNGTGLLENQTIANEGIHFIKVKDTQHSLSGESNPVECIQSGLSSLQAGSDSMQQIKPEPVLFWGDMHGQTKETVGTGTLDQYFAFGRDDARLDFCAWQGNDIQVTDETWANVCKTVKAYHQPGQFVTFLGYEWSGTTPVGGDYNIYYLHDDQPIYRSYHWQIGMDQIDGTDRNPIDRLWKQFEGRNDVMAIPHVGGRYGNLDFCDENLVSLLEIHSHHGTFEWFMEDALKKGLKLGVLAASDDHTCRPGLSAPTKKTSRGLASFDVMGGYTGVYAKELTRESLWEAFKNRHTYGTTGKRILLEVRCEDAFMGDAFVAKTPPQIMVKTVGTDLISEIEIKRGIETIYHYSNTLPIKENTVRIVWSGVRIKSRSKKTKWDGGFVVENGRIKNFRQFAFDQPDEGVVRISDRELEWKSNTSGDIDGFEAELEWNEQTMLTFRSAPICFSVGMRELQYGPVIKDAGGVNQKVEISMARQESDRIVVCKFIDNTPSPGIHPYWVKVTQHDGHMAWSSPIYIDYQGE